MTTIPIINFEIECRYEGGFWLVKTFEIDTGRELIRVIEPKWKNAMYLLIDMLAEMPIQTTGEIIEIYEDDEYDEDVEEIENEMD